MKSTLQILKKLIPLFFFLYPLLTYFGFKYFDSIAIYIGLLVAFLVRLTFVSFSDKSMQRVVAWSSFVMIILIIAAMFLRNANLVRLYPFCFNLGLFLVFLLSLRKGHTPVIEILAKTMSNDFSSKAVPYVRKVTQVWSLFFLVNSLIALYTCFYTSMEVWTFYNAFLAYILMAILFVLEFSLRRYMQHKWNNK